MKLTITSKTKLKTKKPLEILEKIQEFNKKKTLAFKIF